MFLCFKYKSKYQKEKEKKTSFKQYGDNKSSPKGEIALSRFNVVEQNKKESQYFAIVI